MRRLRQWWEWLRAWLVQPDPWEDPVDLVTEEDSLPALPEGGGALAIHRYDPGAAEWDPLVGHAADLADAAARAGRLGPGLYLVRTGSGFEVGSVLVRPARRAGAATRPAAAAWN